MPSCLPCRSPPWERYSAGQGRSPLPAVGDLAAIPGVSGEGGVVKGQASLHNGGWKPGDGTVDGEARCPGEEDG
jgi:hypothetical protein